MKLKLLFAMVVVVLAMALVPAGGAEQDDCNRGPVACTTEWAVWGATHPGQFLNPKNWSEECVEHNALGICVPSPLPS